MNEPLTEPKPATDNADEAVGALNEELKRLVELSPVPAFALDKEDRFVAFGKSFCDLLGYRTYELSGLKFDKFATFPDQGRGRVRASLLPERADLAFRHADGREILAEVFRKEVPGGLSLIMAADLTERLRLEKERLESEKKQLQSHRIEALGRLAGGVAHDFNNFLAVLLLHVDILSLNLEENSPIRGRVHEIKEVADSIALTVRQLFAFGRKQPMTLAPAELNPVIEKFADEFRAGSGSIELKIDLDPALGICFVDPAQVLQILRNLAANAKNAMPDGGTLKVSTDNIDLGPESSAFRQPPGAYIQITVTDTGVGLEPAAEEHVFEPFFSMKDTDKGAGMALATVYGIVKQSKGYIWVESEVGVGTEFQIQFPRIDAANSPETELSSTGDRPIAEPKTVLLVDDEPAVRRITAEFLKMSDLEVLEAGTGMQALEIAQSHFGPIHLLLTDLSMPLMDGRQVAEKVRKLHPETEVLFMSGNVDHGSGQTSKPIDPQEFIAKPFSSEALTERVAEVLKINPA